eukprot:943370-Rhodomonas_salina.1
MPPDGPGGRDPPATTAGAEGDSLQSRCRSTKDPFDGAMLPAPVESGCRRIELALAGEILPWCEESDCSRTEDQWDGCRRTRELDALAILIQDWQLSATPSLQQRSPAPPLLQFAVRCAPAVFGFLWRAPSTARKTRHNSRPESCCLTPQSDADNKTKWHTARIAYILNFILALRSCFDARTA